MIGPLGQVSVRYGEEMAFCNGRQSKVFYLYFSHKSRLFDRGDPSQREHASGLSNFPCDQSEFFCFSHSEIAKTHVSFT